ncbi:hypothetical protein SUGI_1523640 [Cryptomeria japonica]|uniref:Uncharacterized protein n=1 Tax=Cryptomeria japonica TaxID=3369 RepID=A0AAD3RQK7_CRYJA|nr:hypothetical protein SUGI_1523640 [Cryptomeria japonica]
MQGHNIMSLTIRFVSLRVLGSGIPGRPRAACMQPGGCSYGWVACMHGEPATHLGINALSLPTIKLRGGRGADGWTPIRMDMASRPHTDTDGCLPLLNGSEHSSLLLDGWKMDGYGQPDN